MAAHVDESWVHTGDVRLHVARAGSGPVVILLHGFPESGESWQRQIRPLADAGFTVLAPDLRGFHLSDKPAPVAAYAMHRLVNDVVSLVDAAHAPRAHIVGHDWGGMVAWFVAAHHRQRVSTLTILNAPHPTVYGRRWWRSSQWWRSAYVPLFLTPWLPERLLRWQHGWLVRQMFQRGAARGFTFPREELERFVGHAMQPDGLRGGLNYYRANVRLAFQATALPHIDTPTLVIWGEKDPALGVGLLRGLDAVASDLRIVRLPNVGHWVQQEAPAEVTRALLAHIGAHRQ